MNVYCAWTYWLVRGFCGDGPKLVNLFDDRNDVCANTGEKLKCYESLPDSPHVSSFCRLPRSPIGTKLYFICGTDSSSHFSEVSVSRSTSHESITYGLNLSVITERNLVFVVDGVELLLGDLDSGFGDKEDLRVPSTPFHNQEKYATYLSFLQQVVESVDSIIKTRRPDLSLPDPSALKCLT